MTPEIDKFPGIKAVALEIAYDNDLINRHMSEHDWLLSLDQVLNASGMTKEEFWSLDQWCLTLDTDQILDLATGEHEDMETVVKTCPNPGLCLLFDDIFEPPESIIKTDALRIQKRTVE